MILLPIKWSWEYTKNSLCGLLYEKHLLHSGGTISKLLGVTTTTPLSFPRIQWPHLAALLVRGTATIQTGHLHLLLVPVNSCWLSVSSPFRFCQNVSIIEEVPRFKNQQNLCSFLQIMPKILLAQSIHNGEALSIKSFPTVVEPVTFQITVGRSLLGIEGRNLQFDLKAFKPC